MFAADVEAAHHLRLSHRNAGRLGNPLRTLLVHGESRREHAGMRVGNFEIFEDALNGAVLSERTMERIEDDIGPELGENAGDGSGHIDAGNPVSLAFKRIRTRVS